MANLITYNKKRDRLQAIGQKFGAGIRLGALGFEVVPPGEECIYANPIDGLVAAMAQVTTTRKLIICAPGVYVGDVIWTDVNDAMLVAEIPGTVIIEAVTAYAISIDPAAANSTWSATLSGVELSHGDGLVGLKINNTNVGKRINIELNDIDIESETPANNAIVVTRSGASDKAIRIYANGHGNTIEGLVTFAAESAEDRLRFWGYRLVGGVTTTGAVAAEICFMCCGIKTNGESLQSDHTTNHFACYYETDGNPNVHTACADDDES